MTLPSSLFSVAGKNVLITGGSRGIGRMLVQGYVQAGANVVWTSRAPKATTSNDDNEEPPIVEGCHDVLTSNVGSRAGCEALAEQVHQVFEGRLDILINNAGTAWGEPLERTSGKGNWGFDKVFDLNVKGMFYLTRASLPMLQRAATADNPSRVVNIGSIVGIIPQAAPTHAYDSSKAAVHLLTKKLAADLASDSITVNALAPGFVPSRMSQGLQSWGGTADDLAKAVPLGRLGTPEDMVGASLYLTSRAGAWCTGVILNVDGGAVGATQIPLH